VKRTVGWVVAILAIEVVVILAFQDVARAGTKTTIRVSPFEIARNNRVQLDPALKLAKFNGCEVKDGLVELEHGKCPKLTRLIKAVSDGDVTVDLDGTPQNGTFILTEEDVQISPKMASIAIALEKGWVEFTLNDGKTNDKRAVDAFKQPQPSLLVGGMDATGKLYLLTLERSQPANGCVEESPATWCSRAIAGDSLICIDATKGFAPVAFEPRNHVLLPNKSVSVVVRHLTSQGLEIKQEGERGLFEATVADYTGKFFEDRSTQSEGTAKVPPSCAMVTRTSFAPRLPGKADIKIELHDVNDATKIIAANTLELQVATTYAGAIRLGFSTVFGGAVDRAYSSTLAPGSTTREVVATETGDVNTEVVVGISAYAFDLWRHGGRTYVNRDALSYVLPSPYLGIGVVTAKSDGVQAIPSLHLGLEWELSKSFAFSLDAVARRVTRLADGFSIGSPVAELSTFTQDRYEWGLGFTVSVSPEFLQFAVGKP